MDMKKLISGIVIVAFVCLPNGVFAQTGEREQSSTDSMTAANDSQPATAENAAPQVPQDPQTAAQATAPQADEGSPVQSEPRADYLPVVTNVDVQNNKVVNTATVLSKIKIRAGQTVSRELINQDIKRLYSTGYFKDVKVDLIPDGKDYKVLIVVDEKPVIKSLEVTGSKLFKKRSLMKEIGLKEGQVLDQKLLKEAIHNIELKYKKKGYRFVFVKDDIRVDEDAKEVYVTIEISEGDKFKIETITFKGNDHYTEKKLRKVMKTKRDGLFTSGAFDELKFEDDIDRLKLFYQRDGYLDVNVEPIVNYDNAQQKIFIEMIITEGKQYKTKDIQMEGNVMFPKMDIWERLKMLPGETYSPDKLHDDMNNIKKYYFEKGHIEAQIEPDVTFDKDAGSVNVKYKVVEGDVYYIDKIRIRGNTKTKDIVIRRELRVYPGEKFDGKKLDLSKQRLEDLGYFETVSYETEPGSAPNKRDLVLKVDEKQTGEFSFGGGVSSVENWLGFAELSQNNFDMLKWPTFTGDGQKASIKGRWGAVSRDVDVNFLEPYLFDKPYSLGVHGYRWEEDVDSLDFATERLGASLTLGKKITDALDTSISYGVEKVKMKDISDDAAPDVVNTNPDAWLSKLKWSVGYDRRDSKLTPTKGYNLGASAGLVGGPLGGDEDYYELETWFNKYWSLWKNHVLQLKTKLGTMDEYGDSNFVPVYDRFYAGGLGTIRGFDYRRVGPKGGGNPIGGETLGLASLEYTFPIIENFKGVAFIDSGMVESTAYKFTFDEYAVSAGPGLMINTPIGPVVFYYGYPLMNADPEDENGRFEFSFSRGF